MNIFPRSLFWSLLTSMLLHVLVIAVVVAAKTPGRQPRIEVRLPSLLDPAAMRSRSLLKNTLVDTSTGRAATPLQSVNGSQQRVESQQRRLAEHVFYPPEAVAQGLQGEVRLLLRLDAGGKLVSARVLTSSGYDLLDQAAISAAYATGRFPGMAGELLLPVDFRLSE